MESLARIIDQGEPAVFRGAAAALEIDRTQIALESVRVDVADL